MAKQKKCRNCGRTFIPKEKGEVFCSSLCKATGCFVGGGGDTSKPMDYEKRRLLAKKGVAVEKSVEAPKKSRGGMEKFPRVVKMFSLPLEERWELSKEFTEEERKFAQRVAKRMLMEEQKMLAEVEWDGEETEVVGAEAGLTEGERLGDSDDGTI